MSTATINPSAVLAGVRAAPWPPSRQARAILAYSCGYLAEEIGIRDRLRDGSVHWSQVNPDWESAPYEPQDYAADVAAARAQDAARALLNDYRRVTARCGTGSVAA